MGELSDLNERGNRRVIHGIVKGMLVLLLSVECQQTTGFLLGHYREKKTAGCLVSALIVCF